MKKIQFIVQRSPEPYDLPIKTFTAVNHLVIFVLFGV